MASIRRTRAWGGDEGDPGKIMSRLPYMEQRPRGFCNFGVLEKPHCLRLKGHRKSGYSRIFWNSKSPCLSPLLGLEGEVACKGIEFLPFKAIPKKDTVVNFALFISRTRKLRLQEGKQCLLGIHRYEVADREPSPDLPGPKSHILSTKLGCFPSQGNCQEPSPRMADKWCLWQ